MRLVSIKLEAPVERTRLALIRAVEGSESFFVKKVVTSVVVRKKYDLWPG